MKAISIRQPWAWCIIAAGYFRWDRSSLQNYPRTPEVQGKGFGSLLPNTENQQAITEPMPYVVYVLVFTALSHGAPTMTAFADRAQCREAEALVARYSRLYPHECYSVVVLPR